MPTLTPLQLLTHRLGRAHLLPPIMSVAVPNWARNNRVYGTFRRQISNDPTALFGKVIALQGAFWVSSLILSTILYFLNSDFGWPALFRFDKLGIIGGYKILLPAIAFTMNAGFGYICFVTR